MSKKKVLLLSMFIIAFCCNVNAQKQDERNYTSQLYSNTAISPTEILFLYRPEFFTKKSFEKFMDYLTDSCSAHHVNVLFARNPGERGDSLRKSVQFVCRMSSTQVATKNNLYKLNPGEFRKYYIGGASIGDFSVIGYLNNDMDNPVWKCGCINLISEFSRSKEKEAAKCIFMRMLHDGIIK